MKVGIITFHASHNYGSMLQAFALCKTLEMHGCEVEIINFRSEKQYKLYPFPFDFKNRTVKGFIGDVLLGPISAISKWSKYEDFMKKNLPLTREYHSFNELQSEKWSFDVLIVGSDQIWNTHCLDWDEAYFGNFIDKSITKIAYAPSMGRCPEENVDKNVVKSLCHGFKHLSVREPRTLDFLKSAGIKQNIDIVLDPTLLLNEHDYDHLYDTSPLIKGDYIYYYDPFNRKEYLRAASIIGEKIGLPVVCDMRYYFFQRKGIKNVKYFINVGPSEFLNLIKNARMVCGHSFHSVVFSILFKKEFLALDGDKDSRLSNLLNQLALTQRAVNMDNPIVFSNEPLDYDTILRKLEIIRQPSLAFLAKCGLTKMPNLNNTK